jgi:hypothetical protein
MDETSKSRLLILLTLALYQDCNTLVTRIEIRIMRLRGQDKGYVASVGLLDTIPSIQLYYSRA